MLYISYVEFQFRVYYIQLPLEKKANLISKGARLWQGGGNPPPPPILTLNEVLHTGTLSLTICNSNVPQNNDPLCMCGGVSA